MTFWGWVSMGLSVTFVVGLVSWCYGRVLSGGPARRDQA